MDVIWGEINRFVTDEVLEQYDKVFRGGHLSIYKNNVAVNYAFRLDYSGIPYRDILSDSRHFGFDETKGMVLLFRENGLRIYEPVCHADINFYHYDMLANTKHNEDGQYFVFNEGHILQYDRFGRAIGEYAYIHLQKRQMYIEPGLEKENFYYIESDGFYSERKKLSVLEHAWKCFSFSCRAHINSVVSKVKWNLAWKLRWEKNSYERKNKKKNSVRDGSF